MVARFINLLIENMINGFEFENRIIFTQYIPSDLPSVCYVIYFVVKITSITLQSVSGNNILELDIMYSK